MLLGIATGLASAAAAAMWCLHMKHACELADEAALEAARTGADASAWTEEVEEQIRIRRVSPRVAEEAAGLGLISGEAASAASTPAYAEAYALRFHGVPLAAIWALGFAVALAALEATGTSFPGLASSGAALSIAACDASFRSIPASLSAACAGAAGLHASPMAAVGMAAAAALAAAGLSRVRSTPQMGTGDILLFLVLGAGSAVAGALLEFSTFAAAALAAVLAYRIATKGSREAAIAPIIAVPYLLSWAVA